MYCSICRKKGNHADSGHGWAMIDRAVNPRLCELGIKEEPEQPKVSYETAYMRVWRARNKEHYNAYMNELMKRLKRERRDRRQQGYEA